jgi:hypothetical protein
VLLFDPPLTFREVMTHEPLPLARIFPVVLGWLGGRPDAALFGAQAVNAWVETPRMTADVDILSTCAEDLAEALRAHLAETLHLAVRVREVLPGAFRIYQVRQPKNRHLVDVRQIDALPEHRLVEGVRVLVPLELAAMKVISIAARKGQPKGDTDRADLRRLLLAVPDLRRLDGPVRDRLTQQGASESTLRLWEELVAAPLEPESDDDY